MIIDAKILNKILANKILRYIKRLKNGFCWIVFVCFFRSAFHPSLLCAPRVCSLGRASMNNILQVHSVIGKHQQAIWGLKDRPRLGVYSPDFFRGRNDMLSASRRCFWSIIVSDCMYLPKTVCLVVWSGLLLCSSLWILRFIPSLVSFSWWVNCFLL